MGCSAPRGSRSCAAGRPGSTPGSQAASLPPPLLPTPPPPRPPPTLSCSPLARFSKMAAMKSSVCSRRCTLRAGEFLRVMVPSCDAGRGEMSGGISTGGWLTARTERTHTQRKQQLQASPLTALPAATIWSSVANWGAAATIVSICRARRRTTGGFSSSRRRCCEPPKQGMQQRQRGSRARPTESEPAEAAQHPP